ncbi:MAG: hypothetical protein HKM06_09845 [Spirochaetales bacterium]|nr:hypothetical protein [Spirochaetales bacterium]
MKLPRFSLILGLWAALSCPAFGENPKWLEISTQHFTFVFQPQDLAVARHLSSFAEDVYKDVTGYLGWRPRHVEAVIRSTSDEANGFFAFGPKRLNLFIAPPTFTLISAYSQDYLRNLLVHEFTHYVHLTQPYGAGSLDWLFGPDAAQMNLWYLPGWAVEGITTNTEGMFASGGRARNPFFEMEYKAPILEHKMWSYDQAGYGSYAPPFGDRIYVSGFIMVNYLRHVWGEGAFNTIYQNDVEDPLAFFWGYNRSLARFTGKTPQDFFDGAQDYAEKDFKKDAQFKPGRTLSPEGNGDWYLPYKTQRGWIGWAQPVDRRPGVYLEGQDLPNSPRPELLFPVVLSDPYSFGVSRDGKSVIYSAVFTTNQSSEPEADTAKFELWLWKNGQNRRLTQSTGFYDPRLAPDAKTWYAFQRIGTEQRLVKGDLEGHFEPIFSRPGHLLQMLEVSPDGKKLALTENAEGLQVLTILDTNGRVLQRFNPGAAVYFPRWVDNSRVTFSTDKDGRLDLELIDLAQKTLQVLPRDPVGNASGLFAQGRVIYQTQTPRGLAVKEYPDVGPAVLLPWPPQVSMPVRASAAPPLENSRPFLDVPEFTDSFPAVQLASSSVQSDFGLGWGFSGTSLLETQTWNLQAEYFSGLNLWAGLGNYSWRAEGWQGSFTLDQQVVTPAVDSVLNQTAAFVAQVPWGEWDTPQAFNRLTTAGALVWSRNFLATGAPFPGMKLMGELGTTWVWSENEVEAPAQFFGNWGLEAFAGANYTPALWDQTQPREDFDGILGGSLPLGPVVLKTLVHGTVDTTHSLVLSTPTYQPLPLNTSGLNSNWRSDLKLDLLWPAGVADVNVAGLGILRQGLGVWASAGVQGDWGSPPVGDQGFSYGTEFDTAFQIGRLSFPFYAGVAAQCQPGTGGFLNPQLYLGFNVASYYDSLIPAELR